MLTSAPTRLAPAEHIRYLTRAMYGSRRSLVRFLFLACCGSFVRILGISWLGLDHLGI